MVASGEGRMNFGTWKTSTVTCHNTITARCTIRMIAKVFTERIPSPGTACSPSRSVGQLTIRLSLVALVNKRARDDKRAVRRKQKGEQHAKSEGCRAGARASAA